MKMKNFYSLPVALLLLFGGCAPQQQIEAPVAETPAAKPYANMLQLMRAFPFIHANVVFDTQSIDPAGPQKKSSMSYSAYRWVDSDVYAGWGGVESSALAIAESASLLMIPGRVCSNGLPAPIEREDWKNFSQGLVTAGQAAYKAAQSKNVDALVEASGTITEACSACHDVYRDIDSAGKQRCSVAQ